MDYQREFKEFALMDLSKYKNEVKTLLKTLDIKTDTEIPYDDLASIYLVNFNINLPLQMLEKQFKENGKKNMILQYKYNTSENGKKVIKTVYMKSFGKIESIGQEKFKDIWYLVSLLRSIQQFNQLMTTVGSFYRVESAVEYIYAYTKS